MKTIGLSFLIVFVLLSCAPGTTPTTGTSSTPSSNQSVSPESEARVKTQKMKTALGLTADQESKVMLINTVNLKLIKSLRESNQADKLPATRENYLKELEGVLTPAQFAKYKQEFEGM